MSFSLESKQEWHVVECFCLLDFSGGMLLQIQDPGGKGLDICTSKITLKFPEVYRDWACLIQLDQLLSRKPSILPLAVYLNHCPRMGWD